MTFAAKHKVINVIAFAAILLSVFVISGNFAQAQSIQTEYITVAINSEFVQSEPDWQESADAVIDRINSQFAEKTQVQYVVEKYEVYDIYESWSIVNYFYHDLAERRDYLHLNNQEIDGEKPFSTSVFFYIATEDDSTQAKYREHVDNGYVSAGVWAQEKSAPFDETYIRNIIFSVQNPLSSADRGMASILGEYTLNTEYVAGTYDRAVGQLTHELGHSFGLGFPEDYLFLNNVDNSGVLPDAGRYLFKEKYGVDVMARTDVDSAFSAFHAQMIDENITHQKSVGWMDPYSPETLAVMVKDKEGNPVPGAEVDVYGIRTICRSCKTDPSLNNLASPLLETVYTDDAGQATIKGLINGISYVNTSAEDEQKYITKLVKVYYQDQSAAEFVSQYDLTNFKLQGNGGFVLDVVIDADISPVASLSGGSLQCDAPISSELSNRLSGKIVLQVQSVGEAWYIEPTTLSRYYMKNGEVALSLMRQFGLGITNADLAKIPVQGGSGSYDIQLARRLAGRIVLQVEEHGEAWYIHPDTLQRHYMANGDDAYQLMRYFSLGITDVDLCRIEEGLTLLR